MKAMAENRAEKRSENRATINRYYSVEFAIMGAESIYQFKIWDMSSRGMCVLVRDDSAMLKFLKVGDVLKVKYYDQDSSKPHDFLNTEIRHITKDVQGRFKGHYLVGLHILEDQDLP